MSPTAPPPDRDPDRDPDRESAYGPDRLERALRSDSLLPLPLGLVSRVLTRIADEPLPIAPESDTGPVAHSPSRRLRPLRLAAMAAAVLLALGAGIGGLWSATTGDGLAVFGPSESASAGASAGARASISELTAAARASTSASVRSLATVPDQMPGSPAALGAGSLVLLGAAVLGARRRSDDVGGERATGPASDTATSGVDDLGRRSS